MNQNKRKPYDEKNTPCNKVVNIRIRIIPARTTLLIDGKKTVEIFADILIKGGYDYDSGSIDCDLAYQYLEEHNTLALEFSKLN